MLVRIRPFVSSWEYLLSIGIAAETQYIHSCWEMNALGLYNASFSRLRYNVRHYKVHKSTLFFPHIVEIEQLTVKIPPIPTHTHPMVLALASSTSSSLVHLLAIFIISVDHIVHPRITKNWRVSAICWMRYVAALGFGRSPSFGFPIFPAMALIMS